MWFVVGVAVAVGVSLGAGAGVIFAVAGGWGFWYCNCGVDYYFLLGLAWIKSISRYFLLVLKPSLPAPLQVPDGPVAYPPGLAFGGTFQPMGLEHA